MNSIRLVLAAAAFAAAASAEIYQVGPGTSNPTLATVPWTTLKPGDVVNINRQPTPYKEKWIICGQGAATAPITVQGVPDATGAWPVIDGDLAVTPPSLNFWNQDRGLIKIGGGTGGNCGMMPQYIVIQNLEIINARHGNAFFDYTGRRQRYASNAAGIYIEKGQHIAIRNCTIHGNSNGMFVSPNGIAGDPITNFSGDILVEANSIYGNGNRRSDTEHNVYTEALGITYQYNHFGPPAAGSNGNNIKDRSSGTVIRYNWIEGGARELDLVDSAKLPRDASYNSAYVYGNVILEISNDANRQVAHFGGDSGVTGNYRQGPLYFYDNTVVSQRTDGTAIFRLDLTTQHVDARNNILYASAGPIAFLESVGVVDSDSNWINGVHADSFSNNGTVTLFGRLVVGTDPGFVNASLQDYHLAIGSNCRLSGTSVLAAPNYPVTLEYVKHQSFQLRDNMADIGAFEYR